MKSPLHFLLAAAFLHLHLAVGASNSLLGSLLNADGTLNLETGFSVPLMSVGTMLYLTRLRVLFFHPLFLLLVGTL